MIYDVKPLSQHGLVQDPAWDNSVCGIASMYMVMRFVNPKTRVTGDSLMQACLGMDGYLRGIGWKHKELARAAHSFGYAAQSHDWYMKSPQEALKLLKKELQKGPIVASIYNHFTPGNGGHLIVVNGMEGENVYIQDPDEKETEKITKEIPLDVFLNGWKRRIITVRQD